MGVEEYGYVAPDPLDPDIVYGGKITRYDRRTGRGAEHRAEAAPRRRRTASCARRRSCSRRRIRTRCSSRRTSCGRRPTAARAGRQISPDLTRKTLGACRRTSAMYRGTDRGQGDGSAASSTRVAPSPLDINAHLGRHRRRTDPRHARRRQDVDERHAAGADAVERRCRSSRRRTSTRSTAYAAINTLRLDDLRPHIYRTHDGGKTWTRDRRTAFPTARIVNVVREDPKRAGLLFAGTERQVCVSFDDGDHWQSLRLNMPATSIRDLVDQGRRLVVGTHGRGRSGFSTTSRRCGRSTPQSGAATPRLFKPQRRVAFGWNKNTDTPLPPDEPRGQNPPDGAIIDYALPAECEVGGARDPRRPGRSRAPLHERGCGAARKDAVTCQPTGCGRSVAAAHRRIHRLTWDLHYPPPQTDRFEYPSPPFPVETTLEPKGRGCCREPTPSG